MLQRINILAMVLVVAVFGQAPAPSNKGGESPPVMPTGIDVKNLPKVMVEIQKVPDSPIPPERPWAKWFWDEAGGAYVSAFLSALVGGATWFLLRRQNVIQAEMQKLQTATNTLQADTVRLQSELNQHQIEMDARQNLESEGKLYIPLYLKVLSNNRQWQYLMTEMDEYVIRAIKEAQQRGLADGQQFTADDVKNVEKGAKGSFLQSNANGIDAAVRALFQRSKAYAI